MKYSLAQFLQLSTSEQAEYWSQIEAFIEEAHMTYCAESIEANTDCSIGSGRIPQIVKCDCEARKL